jgi:hypothetical protein
MELVDPVSAQERVLALEEESDSEAEHEVDSVGTAVEDLGQWLKEVLF